MNSTANTTSAMVPMASLISSGFFTGVSLPIRWLVVLQELPPHVCACVESMDDRIDDACAAVDAVQRRAEALFDFLARGDLDRIFVGDPPCIDAVHMDAGGVIVRRG